MFKKKRLAVCLGIYFEASGKIKINNCLGLILYNKRPTKAEDNLESTAH